MGGGQNRLKPHSHFTHSHKLPKIALSLALLLGIANVALAEESGGFVGLGIGGNKLTGKAIDEIKDTGVSNLKVKDTGFDVALNVGVRANIATHHGIELVARVPFLPVKMIDYADEMGTALKLTFGQTYSILARYVFSF